MIRVVAQEPVLRLELARSVLGRPLHRVSVFRLGDTLVDSGPPATAGALVEWARSEGLRRVVHTHHHEDHAGGDHLLRRELRVEILAGRATAAILREWHRIPLYRRLVWGQPRSVEASGLESEVRIGDRVFQVIATPGHCPDHVAFWDPSRRWVFTGDLYVAPRPRYLEASEDPWTTLASLETVRSLRPELLFCGHAGVVRDPVAALGERIGYWLELADQVRDLRSKGVGYRAIRRELLGREGLLAWISGGEFTKENLVRGLGEPQSGTGFSCQEP